MYESTQYSPYILYAIYILFLFDHFLFFFFLILEQLKQAVLPQSKKFTWEMHPFFSENIASGHCWRHSYLEKGKLKGKSWWNLSRDHWI